MNAPVQSKKNMQNKIESKKIELSQEAVFDSTAIIGEKGDFKHFGIHEITASVYGYKVDKIVKVVLQIHCNQLPAPPIQEDPNPNEADYWGWYDYADGRFTMIYGKWFLLDMCFPSGIRSAEKVNHGKAYRLLVKTA